MNSDSLKRKIEKVRIDFPILSKKLIYLDNASTSQKPMDVISSVVDLYTKYNANIHRGVYEYSEATTEKYEESKELASKFIGANSGKNIVYNKNCTEGLNMAALMLSNNINEGDEILISIMEHHSNILPWLRIAKQKKATIRYIYLNTDLNITLKEFKEYFNKRTKIVALTHTSNVIGAINPVEQIGEFLDGKGIFYIVDGAQAVSHLEIDVRKIKCDFYAFSAHKMLGCTGLGVLYISDRIMSELTPVFWGGDMVTDVKEKEYTLKDAPYKFESGTSNYEGAISLSSAIKYINNISLENIIKWNRYLWELLNEELKRVNGIKIFSSKINSNSLISFNLAKVHSHDLATMFSERGICVRAGYHCAQPLISFLGENSLVRVSLHFYNNEEDVQAFAEAFQYISKKFI